MCPPTFVVLLALATMAMAFHRTCARMSRSISRSPGYSGCSSTGMVFRYGVEVTSGTASPCSRRPSITPEINWRASCGDLPSRTNRRRSSTMARCRSEALMGRPGRLLSARLLSGAAGPWLEPEVFKTRCRDRGPGSPKVCKSPPMPSAGLAVSRERILSRSRDRDHLGAQVGPQGLRDPDAAVGLLMGLDQRHEEPGEGGAGTVEQVRE